MSRLRKSQAETTQALTGQPAGSLQGSAQKCHYQEAGFLSLAGRAWCPSTFLKTKSLAPLPAGRQCPSPLLLTDNVPCQRGLSLLRSPQGLPGAMHLQGQSTDDQGAGSSLNRGTGRTCSLHCSPAQPGVLLHLPGCFAGFHPPGSTASDSGSQQTSLQVLAPGSPCPEVSSSPSCYHCWAQQEGQSLCLSSRTC